MLQQHFQGSGKTAAALLLRWAANAQPAAQRAAHAAAWRQQSPGAVRGSQPCASSLIEDCSHTIRDHHIRPSVWDCMVRLRGAGHEAYVVGGTVRDLLLGQTPKDYDLLTSATLDDVGRLFRGRALRVGKAFPIALVRLEDTVVEVASLHTGAAHGSVPSDVSALLPRRHARGAHRSSALGATSRGGSRGSGGATWASARRANAAARDFTVNALLYDPFSRVVYDYVGGAEDVRTRTLRCVGDAHASLSEDPVRILRAVRCAARAGLQVEPSLASALAEHGAAPPQALSASRLQLEVRALLCYGAARASMQLLWQHRLLDWLLPLHADYLHRHAHPRHVASSWPSRGSVLMDVLERQDAMSSAARPAAPEAMLALLSAPLLVERLRAVAAEARAALEARASGAAAGTSARVARDASSGGGGGEGTATVTVDGRADPAVRALLAGKQGLSRVVQQLVEGCTHQVAATSVRRRQGVTVLGNKGHAAAGLLMTHWQLTQGRNAGPARQQPPTSGSRAAAVGAAPAASSHGRVDDDNTQHEGHSGGFSKGGHAFARRGAPDTRCSTSLFAHRSQDAVGVAPAAVADNDAAADAAGDASFQRDLLVGSTQSGIVWLKPLSEAAAAQRSGPGRGLHSTAVGGGGARGDALPSSSTTDTGLTSEQLVHEVLTAAGVDLQELSPVWEAAQQARLR